MRRTAVFFGVSALLALVCAAGPATAQWGAENRFSTCHDGLDNDFLLFGLQSDPPQWDCDDTYVCHQVCNECRDGRDLDVDGVVDCQERDCLDSPYCLPTYTPEVCGDGIDNDGFGLADCDDPDCACTAPCGADGGIYSVPAGGPGNPVGGRGYVDPVSGTNCGDPSEGDTSGYCRCLPECITYWTTGAWTDADGDGDDDSHTGHVDSANQGLEVCDDQFAYDEDCDGLVNCFDPDCCGHPHCDGQDPSSGCNLSPEPCSPAGTCGDLEDCSNRIDDDDDGLVDCDDPDCFCPEICDDGIDNDDNGLTDCAEPDCLCHPVCIQPEDCSGLTDLDCDGLVGMDDPDCAGFCPHCEPEICFDGIDQDWDGLVGCDDPDCARYPRCLDYDGDGFHEEAGDCDDLDASVHPNAEEICGDGIDGDCDGQVDQGCVPDSGCGARECGTNRERGASTGLALVLLLPALLLRRRGTDQAVL
jgi:hypothetical protein